MSFVMLESSQCASCSGLIRPHFLRLKRTQPDGTVSFYRPVPECTDAARDEIGAALIHVIRSLSALEQRVIDGLRKRYRCRSLLIGVKSCRTSILRRSHGAAACKGVAGKEGPPIRRLVGLLLRCMH